jgi:hypothetical protein
MSTSEKLAVIHVKGHEGATHTTLKEDCDRVMRALIESAEGLGYQIGEVKYEEAFV